MDVKILDIEQPYPFVTKGNSKTGRNIQLLRLRLQGAKGWEIARELGVSISAADACIRKTARLFIQDERLDYLTPHQIITEYREELLSKISQFEGCDNG